MKILRKKLQSSLTVLAMAATLLIPAIQQAYAQPHMAFPSSVPSPNAVLGTLNDGKFIDISRGLATLSNETGESVIQLSIAVPATHTEFTLSIFDGDAGGKWDRDLSGDFLDNVIFSLYLDPGLETSNPPTGAQVGTSWLGTGMTDNQWCDLDDTGGVFGCSESVGGSSTVIANDPDACPEATSVGPGETGACYYQLTVAWASDNDLEADVSNFLKIATSGQVFLQPGNTVGFQAADTEWNTCRNNPDPDFLTCLDNKRTEYDGKFNLEFVVIPIVVASGGVMGAPNFLDFLDGDFDHRNDTDDSNSPSGACQGAGADYSFRNFNSDGSIFETNVEAYLNDKDATIGCEIQEWDQPTAAWQAVKYPPFLQSAQTLAEGALPGNPQDDTFWLFKNTDLDFFTFAPDIWWNVISPEGVVFSNEDPSGNREWELYRVGNSGAGLPNTDVEVGLPLTTGVYEWNIEGADAHNNLFTHTNYFMMGGAECDLKVTKTCQPRGELLCETAIVATSLRWTGPYIAEATVTIDAKKTGSATYTDVELIPGITVLGEPPADQDVNQNGWTIDGSSTGGNQFSLGANITITIDGYPSPGPNPYVEVIHTSCSQVYEAGFPAPLDGTTPNPVGAEVGDPSPNWFVEGYKQKGGSEIFATEAGTLCEVAPGTEVQYVFRVENSGSVDFEEVVLLDTHFGQINGSFRLDAGDSALFGFTDVADDTTTNVVTANGFNTDPESLLQCVDNASASVIVTPAE